MSTGSLPAQNASSSFLINPQLNDVKIKQISMLYNQATASNAFSQSLATTQQAASKDQPNAKAKKSKSKKRGGRKSVNRGEDKTLNNEQAAEEVNAS